MGATFWVYAGGVWRPLDVSMGRVRGWSGRASFCVARRGRLQVVRAAAVLRGLRALQLHRPTTIRDGLPLSQRRPAPKRQGSPVRCCCAHTCQPGADRNAVVQLNLSTQCPNSQTAPQPTITAAAKADAAVQWSAGSVTSAAGSVTSAARAPSSEAEPPPCKELIVNEDDVVALRTFLERDPRNPFQVDLLRFDEDDDYKSALFYSINPLVSVERSARVAHMLREQRESQSLLREFAGSLGLRAVRERPRGRRARSSDKENRAAGTLAAAGPARANKLVESPQKYEEVSDTSDDPSSGSESSDVFQTSDRVLRNYRRADGRNTRSKFAELSSVRNDISKKQRDDDARSKYLVGKINPKDIETVVHEISDSNDSNAKEIVGLSKRKRNDHLKDTRQGELLKVNEGNDRSRSESNKRSKDREMNDLSEKEGEGRGCSKETDRRKSLRSRNDSQKGSQSPRKGDERSRELRNNESRVRDNKSDKGRTRDSSAENDSSGVERSKRSTDTRRQNRKETHSKTRIQRDENMSNEVGVKNSNSRTENRMERRRNDDTLSPSILGSKTKIHKRDRNTSKKGSTNRSRDPHGRYTGHEPAKNSDSRSDNIPNDSKDGKRNEENQKHRELPLSVDRQNNIELRTKSVDKRKDKVTANGLRSSSRSPTKRTESKSKDNILRPKRKMNTEQDSEDSDGPEHVWAKRNGAAGQEDDSQDRDGDPQETGGRPRRAGGARHQPLRREYSSLEDHAIVQWVSLGARARRVNGNSVWRELQEQFVRIAGRERSWHSLRNRYLRSILPGLAALALPPGAAAALRAAQAAGEIKSRRRAARPNPLLALPAVRSAWGARPRPRRRASDTQDSVMPATSESEAASRTLRSSTQRPPSPLKPPPIPSSPLPPARRARSPPKPSKAGNKSARENQASPTYSEVTRRFATRHSVSTPERAPRGAGPPPRKTRRLYNPHHPGAL